jgi:hypothetical protein
VNESGLTSKDFSLMEMLRNVNRGKPDDSFQGALFDDTSLTTMEDINAAKPPSEEEVLEVKYCSILERMREHELSLADIDASDRQIIKTYLNRQRQSLINSKYPVSLEKHTKSEKLALSFMKNLKQPSYTYKDKKSLSKSFGEDAHNHNNVFLDELNGGNDIFGIRLQDDNQIFADAESERVPKEEAKRQEVERSYNGATDK